MRSCPKWSSSSTLGSCSRVPGIMALRRSVVKRELSRKAKLSVYRSIFVPTLIYGHKFWVVTETISSQVQAAEMSFFCRVAEFPLRDRVRSSAIQEGLGVEPLLFCTERSGLGIELGCLPDTSLVKCIGHVPPVGGPREDPEHAGEIMSPSWPGNALGSLRKSWLK